MDYNINIQLERPMNDISYIDQNTAETISDSTLSMRASPSKNSPQTYSNDQITNKDIKHMIGHISKINDRIDQYKLDGPKRMDTSIMNELDNKQLYEYSQEYEYSDMNLAEELNNIENSNSNREFDNYHQLRIQKQHSPTRRNYQNFSNEIRPEQNAFHEISDFDSKGSYYSKLNFSNNIQYLTMNQSTRPNS